MSVYLVAQLKFRDLAAYRRYQAAFLPVLARSGGRVLAADEAVQVLEGDWPYDKLVLLSFPDAAACHSWLDSPAYREIARDRVAGSDGVGLLVQGLEPPAAPA